MVAAECQRVLAVAVLSCERVLAELDGRPCPTEVGKTAKVARGILDTKGVQQAEDVTGPYGVIVRVEASMIDQLGKLVVARVQALDGITRTPTCPVVHL